MIKKIILAVLCISLLCSTAGFAYCLSSVEVVNSFETGIVDIHLSEYQNVNGVEEPYKEEEGFLLPGDKVSRILKITNDGADCYVRAKISFRDDCPIDISNVYGISEGWATADDGYMYYKIPLKSEESIALFEGIKIPVDLEEVYQKDVFYMDIDVDAVQAKNFNPDYSSAAPWGSVEIVKCEASGEYEISSLKKSDSQQFKIEYQGSSEQLLSNKDNFFANFPYLMPGDKYSDSIVISNDSAEDIKLHFRNIAEDDSELLDKVLLTISTEINGESTVVYSGTLRAEELLEDSTLGTIKSGEKGTFKFEISVPAELDNKYVLMSSNVRWIFSTEPIKVPENPKTGDYYNMYLCLGLMIVSVAGLIVLTVVSKKEDKKDEG